MPTLDELQRWLDGYIAAWRSHNADQIKALFSDDAVYYPLPYDQPLHGSDAIATAWLADQDPPGSWAADYRAIAVNGELGVAEGVTHYQALDGRPEREYANVFILRFDPQGRCCEYMEWWVKRPEQPPGS